MTFEIQYTDGLTVSITVTADPGTGGSWLPNHPIISWGDGTESDWLEPYGNKVSRTAAHSWTKSGTYDVKVKAKDDPDGDGDLSDGLESVWSDTLTVYVCENRNPQIIHPLEGPLTIRAGKKSDPYFLNVADPEGEQVYCWFDWGDGTNTGWVEGRWFNTYLE